MLVDFWAEWCGPCRMLGPVLEKVEKDLKKFLLVKVNTDQNQKIALEYKVNGIPDVKLFINTKVVGQFTGALPEPMVLKFLSEHLPAEELEPLLQLAKSQPLQAAEEASKLGLHTARAAEIYWLAILAAARLQQPRETLLNLLKLIPASGSEYSQKAVALQQYLHDKENIAPDVLALLSTESERQLRQSLELILNQIEQSNAEERETHKSDILLAFQLLGPTHILSNEFRQRLSKILF